MTNTINEILDQFTGAMANAGIVTDDAITADGHLHRIHVEGQRRGSKNAAYILHSDGFPAGWYMDFKTGTTGIWSLGGGRWQLDEVARRQIDEAKEKRKIETEARQAECAKRARSFWDSAIPCRSHPYLSRKQVQAHGLRFASWAKWAGGPGDWHTVAIPDALLIPLRDEFGNLCNVQGIFPEVHPDLGRDRDFMPGRTQGLFHWIGQPTPTVMVCEGYATGASVHEMTGNRVYVAFSAHNLKPVAQIIRKHKPDAEIIVCADNDRFTPGNPGVKYAKEAAIAVKGKVSIPEFPEGCTGTDWNDLFLLEGANG